MSGEGFSLSGLVGSMGEFAGQIMPLIAVLMGAILAFLVVRMILQTMRDWLAD